MVLLTAIEYLRDEQIEVDSGTFQSKKEEVEELETEEAWSVPKLKRSKADLVAILLLVGKVLHVLLIFD